MQSNSRWTDLQDQAAALLALVSARLLVATRPVGALVTQAPADARLVQPSARDRLRAMRLARAVRRAGRYWPLHHPSCLVSSLALHRLLERRGIRGSTVRIGVRSVGGAFSAHAWVEHAGVILGEPRAHTDAFALLTDAALARRERVRR